jgi:hypothetical protein
MNSLKEKQLLSIIHVDYVLYNIIHVGSQREVLEIHQYVCQVTSGLHARQKKLVRLGLKTAAVLRLL